MFGDAFIALINNAALLLALGYAYSLISVYEKKQVSWPQKTLMGMVVGAIGLCIMLLAYEPEPGIKFDARSVLLAASGLFLGNLPTLIAMAITGSFAWVQGGSGAAAGVMIILSAGLIGILWSGLRRGSLVDITWKELFLFGATVHAVILNLFYILPLEDALNVLAKTWIPVLVLYPPLTMLFCRMLAFRLQRERDAALVRASEAHHRGLFEKNHSVMLLIDPASGIIQDANTSAASFYGLPREKLIGKNIADVTDSTEPEPEDLSAAATLSEEKIDIPVRARHRALGQLRDVEVYSNNITIGDRTLQYAIIHDITEQKRLEDQLQQAQKMEAVGWLAGGIAHDYNNKLQAVLGFSEMAEKEAIGRPRLRGYLGEIRKAARHSAQLTMQLMAFARKQTLLPEALDLNATIANMLNMIKNMLGEDIQLEWKPGHDLWHVLTDASQFDRVLVNLALNARDAIPDVGKITLETANATINTAIAARYPDVMPGDYVKVSITDTGTGMTPEQLRHIFEPFYTTKEIGRGTGLGLASVYGVIRQNKGFIDVTSSVGTGTTFDVYLPRTHSKPADTPRYGAATPDVRGKETILLVEDEKLVLDLIRETLGDAGFKVIACGDPNDAIKKADDPDQPIDLLVTDVIMPGMNGRVLYETLSATRPGLNVLYMSGYTANANISRGVLDSGSINYIQKPFSISTIAGKVREILDGTKPHRATISPDNE